MKKCNFLFLIAVLVFGMATTVFAAGSSTSGAEIDGSVGFGTGPNNFDPAFGMNFGGGYTLPNLPVQVRADVSYFKFERSVVGASFKYTRIPFTFSGRYYFPVGDKLKFFAQGGAEVSIDKLESPIFLSTTLGLLPGTASESKTNFGASAGGGVEFFFNPHASVFGLARFHVITDNYFSMHFGGAYHF